MAKNAKVFFEVNFSKEIIADYIREHYENTQEEIHDDSLEQLFTGIIARIVEEGSSDFRRLYKDKNYSFMQVKVIGLKDEPKANNVEIEVGDDTVDIVAKTTK